MARQVCVLFGEVLVGRAGEDFRFRFLMMEWFGWGRRRKDNILEVF